MIDTNNDEIDLYAAEAMKALIMISNTDRALKDISVNVNYDNQNNNFKRLAKCAFDIAEAMLAEKRKRLMK